MRTRTILPAALTLLAFGVACNDEAIVEPQHVHVPAIVEISPTAQTLVVGEHMDVAAEVHCACGAEMQIPVAWATNDPAVAIVDAETGRITAIGSGTVNVTAAAGELTETFVLEVAERVAGEIVLELLGPMGPKPAASSYLLEPGQRLEFRALVYDKAGVYQPDWEVEWASSDDNGLGVFESGLVTAREVGDHVATASSYGASASVGVKVRVPPPPVERVNVEPELVYLRVGQTAVFEAYIYDAAGNRMFEAAEWSTDDPMVSVEDTGTWVTTATVGYKTGWWMQYVKISATVRGVEGHAWVVVVK